MTPSRLARFGLLALTSGVAAVTFTISFHGLDGFGWHVMRLGRLSPLVPAGVDLASLVALLAAHMRRGEPWGRRSYAWSVFVITAALSVAGNLADGMARGLLPAGLVGVAMAPVVFVLVSHLAITSWRSTAVDPPATDAGESDEPAAPAEQLTATVEALEVAAAPVVRTRRRSPGPQQQRPDNAAAKVARIRSRYPDATQAEVAKRAGTSKRTVARYWTDTTPTPNGGPVPAEALADTTEPAVDAAPVNPN
jgi:Protein of unknown function (DUF2637)